MQIAQTGQVGAAVSAPTILSSPPTYNVTDNRHA